MINPLYIFTDYNTIQYNTIQYNAMQNNTIQYNKFINMFQIGIFNIKSEENLQHHSASIEIVNNLLSASTFSLVAKEIKRLL